MYLHQTRVFYATWYLKEKKKGTKIYILNTIQI